MKKTYIKIAKILSVAMMIISIGNNNMTPLAASKTYDFDLANTGQVYTYDSGSKNQKVNTGEDWSLRVTNIVFTTNTRGYGMAFIPITSAKHKGGHHVWMTTTGKKYGTYDGYTGATGYYYLGARIDDDLSGRIAADGKWNSDYVSGI